MNNTSLNQSNFHFIGVKIRTLSQKRLEANQSWRKQDPNNFQQSIQIESIFLQKRRELKREGGTNTGSGAERGINSSRGAKAISHN